MDYTNRTNALNEDKIYSLTTDGVESEGNIIPYTSIKAMHLKYAPSRYYSNIYTCKIKHLDGEITLCNRRYIKLATFEYQSYSYNKIIKVIHSKVDDKVVLHGGLSRLRYWIELPLSIAFFSLIIGVIFTFGHPLLATLFLLILLWRLIPYYRKNFPRNYSKNHIPNHLLPTK